MDATLTVDRVATPDDSEKMGRIIDSQTHGNSYYPSSATSATSIPPTAAACPQSYLLASCLRLSTSRKQYRPPRYRISPADLRTAR
jgi:hypothetical protein